MNVLPCVYGGNEERRRVNIIMCVVCVEDVEGRGYLTFIVWICRLLDILVTLEWDSQLELRTTE